MKIERFTEYASSIVSKEWMDKHSSELKDMMKAFPNLCRGIDWADKHPTYELVEKIIDCNNELLHRVYPIGDKYAKKQIHRPKEVIEGDASVQKEWWVNFVLEHYKDGGKF